MWQKVRDRYYMLTNGQRYLFWFVLVLVCFLLIMFFFWLLSVLPREVTGVILLLFVVALLAVLPYVALQEDNDL